MIRESEVKYLISQHVPALAVELALVRDENDIYRAIECLTAYAKTLIRENRNDEIPECFNTACQLLHDGNRLVQLAIENVFIDPVSRMLEISLSAVQPVRKMFLQNFGKEYYKLINSRNP